MVSEEYRCATTIAGSGKVACLSCLPDNFDEKRGAISEQLNNGIISVEDGIPLVGLPLEKAWKLCEPLIVKARQYWSLRYGNGFPAVTKDRIGVFEYTLKVIMRSLVPAETKADGDVVGTEKTPKTDLASLSLEEQIRIDTDLAVGLSRFADAANRTEGMSESKPLLVIWLQRLETALFPIKLISDAYEGACIEDILERHRESFLKALALLKSLRRLNEPSAAVYFNK